MEKVGVVVVTALGGALRESLSMLVLLKHFYTCLKMILLNLCGFTRPYKHKLVGFLH